MTAPFRIDVFECRGTAYDVGLQQAQQYLKTTRGRAFRRRRERRPFAFSFANARHTLETYAPNVWEELQGLADGLAIPMERAVAEFSNGRLRYPKRGCSSVLSAGVYARNYDYNVRRYDRTLIAVQAKGSHASIGFSERFTGRLDGMNEHGLCVGLHFVNEKIWRPGLVCTLIVRIVLDQCATTKEAIALLRRLPHGLGFNYSLMDAAGEAAVVEAAPDGIAVRQGEWLACTNHFQSDELQPKNRGDIKHSRNRLTPLEAWAGQHLASDDMFHALNASDSPAFHHGYTKGFGTLHTLVCEPAKRLRHVGSGGDATQVSVDARLWSSGTALGFSDLRGQLGGKTMPFDASRRVVADHKARSGRSGKTFTNADLAHAKFDGVSLARATFNNVNMASVRFDDINFADAVITENCNFRGMRIAGVSVEELLAAYRAKQSGS